MSIALLGQNRKAKETGQEQLFVNQNNVERQSINPYRKVPSFSGMNHERESRFRHGGGWNPGIHRCHRFERLSARLQWCQRGVFELYSRGVEFKMMVVLGRAAAFGIFDSILHRLAWASCFCFP